MLSPALKMGAIVAALVVALSFEPIPVRLHAIIANDRIGRDYSRSRRFRRWFAHILDGASCGPISYPGRKLRARYGLAARRRVPAWVC